MIGIAKRPYAAPMVAFAWLVSVLATGCGNAESNAVGSIVRQMEGAGPSGELDLRWKLADLGQSAAPAICAAFKSASPSVKVGLMPLLREMNDAVVLETLLGALDDRNAGVRKEAAWALAWMPFAQVSTALEDLVGRKEVGDRRAGLKALAEYGDPSTVGLFVKATSDPDPLIRAEAAWALRSYRGEEIVTRCLDLMQDPDAKVRQFAFLALTRASPRHPAIEPVVRTMDGMIGSATEREKVDLARLLGNTHSKYAVATLYGLLEDPSIAVRAMALRGLAEVTDHEVREEPLRSAILGANDEVRFEALALAGERKVAMVVPAAESLLSSSSLPTRRSAAMCLNRVGTVDAATALRPLLSDSDLSMRSLAAGALIRVGDKDPRVANVVEEVRRLAESRISADRRLAVLYLGDFTGTPAFRLADQLAADANVLVAARARYLVETEVQQGD